MMTPLSILEIAYPAAPNQRLHRSRRLRGARKVVGFVEVVNFLGPRTSRKLTALCPPQVRPEAENG